MQKPDHHILVCASFRGTEAKGKCIKKESLQLIPHLEEELADRGLNAMVSTTGCLNLCEEGPVMVIYPQAYWYRDVTSEEAVDEILDALEDGRASGEVSADLSLSRTGILPVPRTGICRDAATSSRAARGRHRS